MDDLNEKAARARKIKHIIFMIILIVLFICFIFPFVLVVINVFKTKADITSNPMALVGEHGFTLENFPEAMRKMDFWKSFANSAFMKSLNELQGIEEEDFVAYAMANITGVNHDKLAKYLNKPLSVETVAGVQDFVDTLIA